jgi:CheY-like chemotaxis protein
MARILVIDDDDGMRSMLQQMLVAIGHEVVLAADGREGVEQYRATPADLVITDLFMPNQEGLETIQQLRREFPEVVIVATSGKTGNETMLAIAKRLGANAVIEKPFFQDQILAIVEKVLRPESRTA